MIHFVGQLTSSFRNRWRNCRFLPKQHRGLFGIRNMADSEKSRCVWMPLWILYWRSNIWWGWRPSWNIPAMIIFWMPNLKILFFYKKNKRKLIECKYLPGMQVLQNAATMLTQKNGTQHTKKTPMMIPTVIAALWSDTW